MAAAVNQNIKSLIYQGMGKLLARDQFQRKGSWLFHRVWSRCHQSVDIQLDKYNAGDKGQFTLNLGVDLPEVNHLLAPELRNAAAAWPCHPFECTLSWRIGRLLADPDREACKGDFWWKLGPTTDLDAMKDDLVRVWEDRGKPWLDAIQEPDHALHAMTSRPPLPPLPPIFAALHLLASRKYPAREVVNQALAQSHRNSIHNPSAFDRDRDAKLVSWSIRMGILALADFEQALQSASAQERCCAAYVLETLGPAAAEATGPLTLALKDPDEAVRRQALRALEAIGPSAAPALDAVRDATRDPDPAVRYAATSALWVIAPAERVPGV